MYRKVELKWKKRSPEILKVYRENWKTRQKEFLADAQIEESRIAAEVILFADKRNCTDEETVRLKAISITLEKGTHGREEGAGRKMDFYCTGK